MKLSLTLYGLIAEVFETNEIEIDSYTNEMTVQQLRNILSARNKKMAGLTYSVAVNNTVQQDDYIIKEFTDIHIMPPFAGG